MKKQARFDPVTGTGYAYGITKGPSLALTVYRMERSGKLTQLHSLPQKGFFMVHDMMLTKNHIIFAIPPVKYDFMQGNRFRHATTFRHWRTDKAPKDCGYDQLEEPVPFDLRSILDS